MSLNKESRTRGKQTPDGPPPEPGEERSRKPRHDPQRERSEPPETTRKPAPGIEHEPEPDGENIIPAKDRPGTL